MVSSYNEFVVKTTLNRLQQMINETTPVLPDLLLSLQLPNGQFVRIDTRIDANDEYRIELLDSTGEFIAGLQSSANA